MTILTRKFTKIFVLQLLLKTHVSNWMHFQGEIDQFFLKNEALRSESVKDAYIVYINKCISILKRNLQIIDILFYYTNKIL